MRYALWTTHQNGPDEGPRLIETCGRLFVGDRLPGGWVTSLKHGAWTDDEGRSYDGRVRASDKKPSAHRS